MPWMDRFDLKLKMHKNNKYNVSIFIFFRPDTLCYTFSKLIDMSSDLYKEFIF